MLLLVSSWDTLRAEEAERGREANPQDCTFLQELNMEFICTKMINTNIAESYRFDGFQQHNIGIIFNNILYQCGRFCL